MIRGEPGHDIIPALYPLEGEPVIDKAGQSAFAYTDLELLLRIKGIKNLVVVGLATDTSVVATIREANDKGFDCILLEDATAAYQPQAHAVACDSIQRDNGVLGAIAKASDVLRAVDNFKRAVGSAGLKVEGFAVSSQIPGQDSLSTPQRPAAGHLPLSASSTVPSYIAHELTSAT